MNGNLGLLIKSCDFITIKKDEPNTFNQGFGFVDSQIMHASYHSSTNYVWPIGFWKILHIKEMQQLAHAFIINHRFTFSEHVEISKNLHQFLFPFTNNNMVDLVNNGVFLNWTIQTFILSMDKILVDVVFSGFTNF
jgi:hypothetical protein